MWEFRKCPNPRLGDIVGFGTKLVHNKSNWIGKSLEHVLPYKLGEEKKDPSLKNILDIHLSKSKKPGKQWVRTENVCWGGEVEGQHFEKSNLQKANLLFQKCP